VQNDIPRAQNQVPLWQHGGLRAVGPATADSRRTVVTEPPAILSTPSLASRAATRAAETRARLHETEVGRLLDAGLELMRAGGAERPPRVADIVRAAGLSNQAFYRYFESKDALVAAVIDAGQRRLVGYVLHQSAKGTTPQDRLRRAVQAVADQAADEQVAEATRAVMGNVTRSSDLGGARIGQLHDLLAAVLAPILRDLGSTDPVRDPATVAAIVVALMQDHLWRGTAPGPADVDHAVAFALAGLAR
jgi:AcrR family transcriptional regulator